MHTPGQTGNGHRACFPTLEVGQGPWERPGSGEIRGLEGSLLPPPVPLPDGSLIRPSCVRALQLTWEGGSLEGLGSGGVHRRGLVSQPFAGGIPTHGCSWGN